MCTCLHNSKTDCLLPAVNRPEIYNRKKTKMLNVVSANTMCELLQRQTGEAREDGDGGRGETAQLVELTSRAVCSPPPPCA